MEAMEIKAGCAALTVKLGDGTQLPRLGQGTWFMGEDSALRENEKASLLLGAELGMTLIDTAEMYGDGSAEALIGETFHGRARDELFLVSKVYPHNAGHGHLLESCKNTLHRLRTDHLDLYLLHWRGNIPLAETVAGMEVLVSRGLIRHWGVSNFDTKDMEELWLTPDGSRCAVNQVLYHLGSRGIEFDLLPWMWMHGVTAMAYCPLAQGGSLRRGLYGDENVRAVARKYDCTVSQVLLAFVLARKNIIAIPKASTPAHVCENAAAGLIRLSHEDIAQLSRSYPPSSKKTHLDIV